MIIICDIHEDIMGILMEYNMIYVYIYGSGTLNQLHRRFAQLSTSISCGDFPATFFQEVGGWPSPLKDMKSQLGVFMSNYGLIYWE